MRHFRVGILLALATALIVTSIAVADGQKPKNFASVSAHFTATGSVKSGTCTRGDASITETRGTFTGTSTSTDTRLNGSARITLKTATSANGFGVASGSLRIGKISAGFTAVVSSTNRLDGFLVGGSGRGDRRLSDHGNNGGKGGGIVANFSATLSGSTLTGDLGTGTHLNAAIIDGSRCNGNDD
jgi:hypothetical protein